MNRRKQQAKGVASVAFLAVIALVACGVQREVDVSAKELKSGRAVIDASTYPDLHAAIEAVPESGGVVYIPPGTYKITRTLWLTRDNTRIQGAGPATHLINLNEKGEHALTLEHADRPNEPLARLTRVEVADLRISGNPKSGDGMFIEGVKELYLEGLTVDHHGEHGIRILDAFEGPRVVGCNVHDNGFDGLYILVGHDIVVSANQFWNNRDGVSARDSTNLVLSGNGLRSLRRDGMRLERIAPSTISGNSVRGCAGRGIFLTESSNAVISGNSFSDLNAAGVSALKNCRGLLVANNGFFVADGVAGLGARAVDLGDSAGSVVGPNVSH